MIKNYNAHEKQVKRAPWYEKRVNQQKKLTKKLYCFS